MKKNDGMELVQVAILVAIAIVIGLIFRTQIQSFVEDIFASLSSGKFE
jgi:large-conductance mechanosensitive channel